MAPRAMAPVAVAVAVYVVYASMAYRSAPGGDAGELLSEACLGGVGHPPGYPLFLLLARLALAMPFPFSVSPAGRVNQLCCALGGLAAGLVTAAAAVAASSTSSVIMPALGGLLFAFSPLVWEYSMGAEVFALNNCLCALLVHLTVVICTGNKSKGWWWTVTLVCCGALVCGLALANQHASLLFMSVLVPGVVWAAAGAGGACPLALLLLVAASALCFLLGLGAPYLHLLQASRIPRPGSWGDTSTWTGLVRHVLRAEYGTFQLGATVRPGAGVRVETAWERVVLYLRHTSVESFHAPFPLAAVGAAGLLLSGPDGRLVAGLMVAAWGVYVSVWHGVLSNLPLATPMGFAVHARFWMQPFVPVCVLAGVGCAHTAAAAAAFLRAPRWVLSAVEVAAVVAAGTYMVQQQHAQLDRSGAADAVMRAYAHAALASLPPRALLAAHTDLDWNGARYLRTCEGARPDITHVNFQLMPFPWFAPRQQPLYPNVTWPPLLQGVSTVRTSEGNALLVRRFLAANGADDLPIGVADEEDNDDDDDDYGDGETTKRKQSRRKKRKKKTPLSSSRHPGGLFVDMQAINEPEIGDAGQWRGLVLLPWGTLYRVLGPLARPAANYSVEAGLMDLLPRHAQSHRRLRALQAAFPAHGHDVRKYPAGTWEHAAYSVFYDAHYQLGLHYLTWAIDVLRRAGAMAAAVPFILDRLAAAADLLSDTLAAAQARGTVSSPVSDVHKNLAVCWMRLHAVVGAMAQHSDTLREQLNKDPATRRWLVAALPPHDLVAPASRGTIAARAKMAVGAYVRTNPNGADTAVFKSFVDGLNK